MINYLDLFNKLEKNRFITPIWKYILELINNLIKDNKNKNELLILFMIYFSLVDDGNVSMSLDKETLIKKWNNKINSTDILLQESEDYSKSEIEEIKVNTLNCIKDYLDLINREDLKSLIGQNKIFCIDKGRLFLKKYLIARDGIRESLDRLFNNDSHEKTTFSYKDCVDTNTFKLSSGQETAIVEGFNKNLIITGGPGTGKTTSILFLLLNLLSDKEKDYKVHLIAPSGKASSRMKESIIKGLNIVLDEYKESHREVVNKILNLEESTIHRLLHIDPKTNAFTYNKDNQFEKNSLFVIDEASMIDITLFNALLSSIPTGARIFIMGDKNQLPSVESGAVFGELLIKESLTDNIVELDESIRFTKGTKIYDLANKINNGLELEIDPSLWQEYSTFKIEAEDKTKPIFYYKNHHEGIKSSDIINHITNIWAKEYFSSLQKKCTSLDPNDYDSLKELFSYSEKSKILCAENEGPRGVKTINKFIKKHFIDKTKITSCIDQYAGQLMMVSKNNKLLDLYNGDSGILVTFKDDDTLYFMVQKSSLLIDKEGKRKDKIFKIGSYLFYPLRLIPQDEIDLSYAITIHKSQGSDYPNILVILPDKKGHPLLNRQIVYTAITRTKGNTYLLTNQDRLDESKDTVMVRDTNIA